MRGAREIPVEVPRATVESVRGMGQREDLRGNKGPKRGLVTAASARDAPAEGSVGLLLHAPRIAVTLPRLRDGAGCPDK
jgi:hypothetical protein